MLEALLIAGGAVCILTGLVGCILPVLPGPPLSFVGLLLLWGARGWQAEAFDALTVILLGLAAVVVTVVDTVAPVIGAKRSGASKAGVWGSVVGMVVGLLGMLPVGPLGMLAGALIGAWVGELLSGKEAGEALEAAWGVFVYTVLGVVLKLAASLAITAYFVLELAA